MLLKTELHFLLVYEGKRKKAADYIAQDRIAFSACVRRNIGKRLQTILLKTQLHFLFVYEGIEEKGCRLRMLKSQLHSCSTTYFGRSLRGKTELLSSILNSTEIKEYLLKRSKRGLLSTDRAASVILPAPLFSTFVKNLRSLMSFPRYTILIFRSI